LLVDEVADRIRQYIEENGLSAGDRLPSETEWLAEHKVSRSVLREAINRLQPFGLVDVLHGKGMFVGDQNRLADCTQFVRTALTIHPRDLTQFGELRAALECRAARRAAERATPAEASELKELIAMLDDRNRPYEESIALDFQFHRRLFEIAGNPLMLNVLVILQQFVLEGMLQTTPSPRDHDVSQELHRAIVEAVRNRDPAAAEAAMERHMHVTCQRLAKHAAP
jgi:GntR family transcriptional repressor for pyruvate dehydrogenase complex